MDELFSKAPVKKAYFTLALPVVMGMITTMIYNLADTIFIAKTGNPKLVAGVTIGAPLFTLLLAIADIFGLGGSSVASRLLGEKHYDQVKRVNSFCIYGGIIMGIALTVILLVFERPFLHLLGANASTYKQAAAFYRILSFGATFVILSVIPQNLIRTEGLAKQAMIAAVAGTVLSIILDPIFIFALRLGTAGVASANVIGYICSDLVLVYMINHRAHYVPLNIRFLTFNPRMIWEVTKIGIPSSITNFALTFGMALLNSSLAVYGASIVAAMGITQKIYGVLILVIVGFAFGAQPLIGYNYGAHQWQRLHEIISFDFMVQIVYAVIVGGLLTIAAHPVSALFMHQEVIVNASAYMLRATVITTPVVGIILVYTTVFQSIGNATGAFIMSISRQGVIYWLVLEILKAWVGYHGIVWSQAVADILTCLIGFVIYHGVLYWKDRLPSKK